MPEQSTSTEGVDVAERPTTSDGADEAGARAGTDDTEAPGQSSSADGADVPAATRVVISYPADLSTWGRSMIGEKSFRAWLRRTLGVVEAGHAWEEFVGVGCCGSALDVPLVVESLEGGGRVGPDTEIEYVEREACGVRGGWQVQSAAGPNEF